MYLSVKSSMAVLMNIGMRKRTYIFMLSLMSFMMAFSQKDTRGGYRGSRNSVGIYFSIP